MLRSRQRGLSILTPVLLTVNGSITILVLVFLRRFLTPFDRLVERARHAGQVPPDSQETGDPPAPMHAEHVIWLVLDGARLEERAKC